MCHGPVAWFMLLYALVSRGSERLPTASVQHGLQKKIKKVKKRDPTTGKDQKKKNTHKVEGRSLGHIHPIEVLDAPVLSLPFFLRSGSVYKWPGRHVIPWMAWLEMGWFD